MMRATACWRFGTCSALSARVRVKGGSPTVVRSRATRRTSSNSAVRQTSRSMTLRCAVPLARVAATSFRQACSRSSSNEKLTGMSAGVHRDLARERRQHMAVATLALQDVEHLLQPDRLLDELLERCPGDGGAAFAAQPEVLRAELDEVILEPGLVLQVLLRASALDAVERGLSDEEVTSLKDLLVVAVEEGQQQRPDVRAVHVGVAHEDDRVIAKLGDVLVVFPYAGAERGD